MSRNAAIERSFESDTETWHAVWVAPGWERRVFDALQEAGFASYLPYEHLTIIRRGRKLDIVRPLFPGYCFVRLAIWRDNSWGIINRRDIEGVGALIKDGALPAAIPERDITGPIYDDIVEFLRQFAPQTFKSNRARKRERARDKRIAKLKAA